MVRLPAPPHLRDLPPASLFIDLDGTLIEFMDRPDAVWVDDGLRALLKGLAEARPGRVALVSGRPIAQLDDLLGSLGHRLAVSGSHGVERRLSGGDLIATERPTALAQARAPLAAFAGTHPGVLLEDKPFGVALHYRMAPEHEAPALALCAAVAETHGLHMQAGAMMAEVRAPGDKGQAVRAFMAQDAMADALPVFVGDDLTDETGFAAAEALGGFGILVGPPRRTSARYGLEDVRSVRTWLAAAVLA